MAFGDTNDIKINVTVDTKAAIDAAKELAAAFDKVGKEVSADFRQLAEAAKALSAARVVEIKKDSAAEVAAVKAASAQKLAILRAELETVKQSEATKRAALEASSKKEIQELKVSLEAVKQAEISKRTELQKTFDERIQKIRAETAAAKDSTKEQVAALRTISDAVKSQSALDIRTIKETEATKRAEIKKTIEDLRLEAAKIRQETALAQIAARDGGAGKAAAFGGALAMAPQLASVVFLAKELASALTAATRATFQLAEAGNRVQALSTAFSTLQQSVGRDPEKSIQRLREATQGLISDTDLYQKANQAVLLGVPAKLFEESAEAAVKLGRAMGIDAVNALESLSIGLGRQSRLYLDNLGIVVSATEAYQNFARENGIVGRELTDAEKRLAFFNETSKQLKDGLSRLPPITRDVGIAYTELKAATSNAQGEFLRAFNSSLELQSTFSALTQRIKELSPFFIRLGEAAAAAFARILDFERLPPILQGTVSALGGLGRRLDEFLVLSEPAKRARFAELGDEIKKVQDRLSETGFLKPFGGLKDQLQKDLQALKSEYQSLGIELDVIDKKREAQKDQKIDLRINTEQLSADAAETEAIFAKIKQDVQESLGVIQIPGLDQAKLDAATPALDAIFTKINQGKVAATEAGAAVETFVKNLSIDIQKTNIDLTTKKLNEARAALEKKPGDEQALVDVRTLEKQLGIQQKSVTLEAQQRSQLIKYAENRRKIQKEIYDDAVKESKRRESQNKKLSDQAQEELERLRKTLSRSLDNAIPADVQRQLIDIFNDPQNSAQDLIDKVIALGEAFAKAKGDTGAFAKEVEKLKNLKDEMPQAGLFGSAEQTKNAREYNKQVADAQKGLINIRDLIYGPAKTDPKTGKTEGGGFFGFDIKDAFGPETQAQLQTALGAESFAGVEAAIAKAIVEGLKLAIELAFTEFTRDDAPQIAQQIGTVLGGDIGGIIGKLIGENIMRNTQDLASTKERKKIDKYFSELFDGGRLAVVIQGQLETAIDPIKGGLTTIVDETTGELVRTVQAKLTRISDIVFEGFTPFAGNVDFGGENFRSYFDTLSTDIQASFNGIGLAFGELTGVGIEQSRLIGVALANNIGGSLQNLQVLIQATGESFDDLAASVLESFLNAKLTIEEAYNALVQLENLYGVGIPGAVGAYQEAIDNLNTSLKDPAPGRNAIDSLRDIGAEGAEARKTFDAVISSLGQTFSFTAEQQARLFEALRINGITSLQQLQNASNEQLLAILRNIQIIRENATAPLVTTPTTTFEAKKPSGGGGSKGKSPQEIAADLLKKQREEAQKLLQESQSYLAILDQINNRQIDLTIAGQEILRLEKELLDAIKQRDAFQKAFDKELLRGRKADKALLADLAAALREVEERLKKAADSAKKANRDYKQLSLTGIIPLIKDQNTLGLVARQVGVSLEKNIDILIKGFVQGRLSIAEVNEEIKKTKDLLGPGIPGAVGAVTEAFQGLLDAGEKGGQFSLDAFTDVFAEFREKFNKEGSALRKTQGEQLRASLDAAQAAYDAAVGPEALEAAKKALDVAKKALKDFYAEVPVPDLADLRIQLETAFGQEQIDKFFQALDESGLSTFEEFEKAGNETIVTILGRLKELGFQFNQTSGNVGGINQGLQDAEKSANAGLDPLQEAINLVKQFNEGAGALPPAFDATTDAINNLNGPLTALANGFQGLIEKLGQLSGQTFENDVVFNVRTTGEAGGKALVELIFGDGSDIGSDTGGIGAGGNQGTADQTAAQRANIRLEMQKLRKKGLKTSADKRKYNKLRERLRALGG